MARISDARKAERLHHAWRLLQDGDDLSDLVHPVIPGRPLARGVTALQRYRRKSNRQIVAGAVDSFGRDPGGSGASQVATRVRDLSYNAA